MAAVDFKYWCLSSHWPSGLVRLDVLGFPEIGAVHAKPKRALALLERRLESLRADPELGWHRRVAPPAVELDTIELVLKPPQARADWSEPLNLQLTYAHWSETTTAQQPVAGTRPARHLAWVPALGLSVLVDQPQQLSSRLQAELKLWLGQRRQRPGLAELARMLAGARHEVIGRQLTLNLDSPRERLLRRGRGLAGENPVLKAVANLLKPAQLSAALVETADLGRLAEALLGAAAHSVLLVGPEGCGKSTLFQQLVREGGKHGLEGWSCWTTSGARLIAGQSGYGMWQQRCRDLCRELAAGKHLLHLGPLRELLEVGRTRAGEQSIAGFLRGEISRGGIRVVAECTPEEMQAIERIEPALIGAFQVVEIAAPGAERQLELLQAEFLKAEGPRLPIKAVQPALQLLDRLHRRYAGYSARPARALRFLRERLAEIFPEKQLEPTRVLAAFSQQSGLPSVLLDEQQRVDPQQLSEWFAARVLGQPEAVAEVVDRLLRIKSGLVRPGRPLASLLLVGPTGTGKTELAKTLAEFLFGSAERLTRFDLSEVTDALALARLVGGPAAGATEGLLTARIREQPFSVLLFDEFEKADPGFFDLLLQMLGEARLTDGAGRLADFSNAVIVLTSNLGAADFQRGRSGFVSTQATPQAHFEQAVQRFLRPELYNRFDAIVPFQALDTSTVEAVARRQLQGLLQRPGIAYGNFELELDPALPRWLAQRGFDPRYGARPLKRALESAVVVPLADALNTPAALPLRRVRLGLDTAAENPALRVAVERGALLPGAQLQTLKAQAELVQRRRREFDALGGCALVQGLRDEQAFTRMRQQRSARQAKKQKAATSFEPLPRLRVLDRALGELDAALAQTALLEDTALLALWSGGAAADPAAVHALQDLARGVRRSLYRASFPQPDRIWLGLYSEHLDWLQLLLKAYLGLAEPVLALWSVTRLRAGETQVKARLVEQPLKFLAEALPADLLGLQLQLKGELLAPLLGLEAGLHLWKPAKGGERIAMVCADVEQVAPPACLALSGGIASSGLTRRRSFVHERMELHDARMEPAKRAWSGESPAFLIGPMVRAALDASIANLHMER